MIKIMANQGYLSLKKTRSLDDWRKDSIPVYLRINILKDNNTGKKG